jgi:hypothetical protein
VKPPVLVREQLPAFPSTKAVVFMDVAFLRVRPQPVRDRRNVSGSRARRISMRGDEGGKGFQERRFFAR